MTSILFKLGTLLLAVAILLCGHGLQMTLLPIRAEGLGWSTGAIGVTASAYFSGFLLSCIVIPGIVARVGHIRGFMVLSALATLVTNEGVQLHGGIGMTDELDIGFFMKRARVAEQQFGDRRYHLQRFASLQNY